jgi:hypothetical protein
MAINKQNPQTVDWAAVNNKIGPIVNDLLHTVEATIPASARIYVLGRIAEGILRECHCELVEQKLFLDEQMKALLDKPTNQGDKKP